MHTCGLGLEGAVELRGLRQASCGSREDLARMALARRGPRSSTQITARARREGGSILLASASSSAFRLVVV